MSRDRGLIALGVISVFCIITLVGAYAYGGSILPVHKGGFTSGLVKYVTWLIVASVPIVTIILLLIRYTKSKYDK